MGVIKVPFDTNGGMSHIREQSITMSNTFSVRSKDLDAVLENAYATMDWFKYLADHALSVEVLEQYYDSPKFMTTHVVGFELEDKHETFYRIKYNV